MRLKSKRSIITFLIVLGFSLPPAVFWIISKFAAGFDPSSFHGPGDLSTWPLLTFSLLEQSAICIAAFGLKPFYEFLSLILIIRLWKETTPDLITFRHALLAFFIGENACAANYLIFKEQSILFEYLHMSGMLLCFAFFTYGLLTFIDRRILKYSSVKQKCIFLNACHKCCKYHPTPCIIRNIYPLFCFAGIALAFMPITGPVKGYYAVGDVFGSLSVFGHSQAQQIFENRIWPTFAVIFFVIALVVLKKNCTEEGLDAFKMFFSAGVGLMGFSLIRFIIFRSYEYNPIWADLWEEMTEFFFIFLFWRIYRQVRKSGIEVAPS